MKFSFTLLTILISFTLFSQDSIALKYSKYVSAADIKEYLTILASDSMEGRETGEPGQKKAAHYIAKQFNSFGIPQHNSTYYQSFFLHVVKPENVSININEKKIFFLKDFYHISNFSNDTISSENVVFIGKEYGDIKNKIVFTLLKYRQMLLFLETLTGKFAS